MLRWYILNQELNVTDQSNFNKLRYSHKPWRKVLLTVAIDQEQWIYLIREMSMSEFVRYFELSSSVTVHVHLVTNQHIICVGKSFIFSEFEMLKNKNDCIACSYNV